MTADKLKAEMEKRINTLSVFVDRINRSDGTNRPIYKPEDEEDDPATMFYIQVSGQGSHAARAISAVQITHDRDLASTLDSYALYLVYDWARERYINK